jgi:hypothetical protein
MHVRNQNNINLAQTGIVWPGDGPAGIVENAGTIRVFKHQRPVAATELAIVTTQRRNLHHMVISGSRHGRAEEHAGTDPGKRQGVA